MSLQPSPKKNTWWLKDERGATYLLGMYYSYGAEFVLGTSIRDFSTCMLKSHEITGFPQNSLDDGENTLDVCVC